MNPLAVPGRWRQITHPATRTSAAVLFVLQIFRGHNAARAQAFAIQLHGMRADGHASAEEIGADALGRGHGGQGRASVRGVSTAFE